MIVELLIRVLYWIAAAHIFLARRLEWQEPDFGAPPAGQLSYAPATYLYPIEPSPN